MPSVRKQLSGWMLLVPALFVLYFAVWRPQIMGFIWSFFKMKGYNPIEFCGFKNYYDVITDTEFVKTLINTVSYVLWSLVIGFIPPIFLAILINEVRKFQNFFKVSIYIPSVLPGIVVMLMWYLMYYPDQSGLINTCLAKIGIEPQIWLNNPNIAIPLIVLSMTWKGMGGTMFLYFTALQGVNTELYEAAYLDGAGVLKRVIHVTLPQMSGVIILNFVSQIIGIFQMFEYPMTMTGGGPDGASMTLGYQMYKYGFVTGRVGQAFALGTVMFIILMFFTVLYFYLNKKVESNFD